VAANYSYTTSQVTFPADFSNGRSDHPTLQRQAPNNWNVGLTYDRDYSQRRQPIPVRVPGQRDT
jgi:hypothetical protein